MPRFNPLKENVILIYVGLVAIGITTVYPLLWMFATSLQPPGTDVSDLRNLIPATPDFSNYRRVFTETNIMRAFLNSLFVTAGITAGQLFTSSLAAYAFARMRFFGRDKIFLGYLTTLMVPATVTMLPTFLILRGLGWVDTYWALIIPGIFSAYGTFMLRQFFIGLPRDLEESAMIDGCGHWKIYLHVVLPLSRNALLTLGILTFMANWKTLMWPLIVTHREKLYTLPVALAKFNEMSVVNWSLLMAGSVVMTLPMLLIFLFGQRFFTKGIMVGAVKG